jgi:hypothetical protein
MKVDRVAYRQFQDKLRFIQQTRFDDKDKEALSMMLMEMYFQPVQESVQ